MTESADVDNLLVLALLSGLASTVMLRSLGRQGFSWFVDNGVWLGSFRILLATSALPTLPVFLLFEHIHLYVSLKNRDLTTEISGIQSRIASISNTLETIRRNAELSGWRIRSDGGYFEQHDGGRQINNLVGSLMSEQEELEEELADDFMSLKLLGAAKWMLVAFPFLTCLITGILILHFFNDESLLSSGEKVRRIVMGITYTIGFTQLLVHLIFVRDEVS